MGSCAAPSAKGDDKFITTDYLQQCQTNHGKLSGEILYRLVGQGKKLFRWRLPEGNPYLRTETRNTYTSRFTEVAMAFASI